MYESGVHVKCTQLCLLLTEYVTFPAWWRSWEGKIKRMDENIIISINMGTWFYGEIKTFLLYSHSIRPLKGMIHLHLH